jgi:hypothetical protein
MIFNFSNYSNSTTYKTFLWRQNVPADSAGGVGNISVTQGLWRSTSPIDRIHFLHILDKLMQQAVPSPYTE